jgi:hypothetical protein
MWKPVLATSAAIMIASTTAAFAQNRPGQGFTERVRPNVEDMRAFADARLAGLKAGLQLNADQEKHWPAFEAAARDFQRQRIESMNNAGGTNNQRLSPVELLQQRADGLSKRGTALKSLADAMGPLYNSLDDGQKRRFAMLNPVGENRGRFGMANSGPRGFDRRQGGVRPVPFEGPGRGRELPNHPMMGTEPIQ